MQTCSVALVQMRAVPDREESIGRAEDLTRQALRGDADLVVLPENHAGIGPKGQRAKWAYDPNALQADPAIRPFVALSRESAAVIVLGGVPERAPEARVFNTSIVLHRGQVAATYRKIHLFRARLEDGTELDETEETAPGDTPVVIQSAFARIGLSICYDLRFPELYRALSWAGAEIIVVPSAFTLLTGIDHWEPLLRARAIEAQAYVVAPAQHGTHMTGRHSFGHSLVVDPWGTVVAQASPGDRVVRAQLDGDLLGHIRARLPSLQDRALGPETSARVVSLTEGDPKP